MILFGGLGVDSVATGSIYILDLPSMEWTQGPPVDALQNRSHMACGVSGDNFLVFGGTLYEGFCYSYYTMIFAAFEILTLLPFFGYFCT